MMRDQRIAKRVALKYRPWRTTDVCSCEETTVYPPFIMIMVHAAAEAYMYSTLGAVPWKPPAPRKWHRIDGSFDLDLPACIYQGKVLSTVIKSGIEQFSPTEGVSSLNLRL